MSALRASNNFGHFLDERDDSGASPEVPGDHVLAGDGHPNDGVTEATSDQADASTSEIRMGAAAVIRARITEVLDGHARKSRGNHYFVQLPKPNDNIIIANRRGSYDIMRVLYSGDTSETTVYVRWIASQRLRAGCSKGSADWPRTQRPFPGDFNPNVSGSFGSSRGN